MPESYIEEHLRLIADVQRLRRDHDGLQRRPFDAAEHREHKLKLQTLIAARKEHRGRHPVVFFATAASVT